MTSLPTEVICKVSKNIFMMKLGNQNEEDTWKPLLNEQRKQRMFCHAFIQCEKQSFPAH